MAAVAAVSQKGGWEHRRLNSTFHLVVGRGGGAKWMETEAQKGALFSPKEHSGVYYLGLAEKKEGNLGKGRNVGGGVVANSGGEATEAAVRLIGLVGRLD